MQIGAKHHIEFENVDKWQHPAPRFAFLQQTTNQTHGERMSIASLSCCSMADSAVIAVSLPKAG